MATIRPASRRERGQALPLLLVVLAAATAAAVLVVHLGVAAVQRARARTAADAAALAGAVEGADAARTVAADNGAELTAFVQDGDVVEVTVRLGRASASAAAEAPPPIAAGATPALAAALARAEQLLGHPVAIDAVVDDGAAVEVPSDTASELDAVAADSGLCRQPRAVRPVHFEPCLPPTALG